MADRQGVPRSLLVAMATLGALACTDTSGLSSSSDALGAGGVSTAARPPRILPAATIAELLRAAGMPDDRVGQMVCTARYESGFNANAMNHNTNGTYDRGLFQINEVHMGHTAGCPADAESYFDETTNTACAVGVYRLQGARAWYAYRSHAAECDATSAPGGGAMTTPRTDAPPTPTPSGGGSDPYASNDPYANGGGDPYGSGSSDPYAAGGSDYGGPKDPYDPSGSGPSDPYGSDYGGGKSGGGYGGAKDPPASDYGSGSGDYGSGDYGAGSGDYGSGSGSGGGGTPIYAGGSSGNGGNNGWPTTTTPSPMDAGRDVYVPVVAPPVPASTAPPTLTTSDAGDRAPAEREPPPFDPSGCAMSPGAGRGDAGAAAAVAAGVLACLIRLRRRRDVHVRVG